ncbi:hypothetical protein AB0C08_37815, partial [Microbispora bryophytorum]
SAVLIGTFVGGTLGVIAGYLRGTVDRIIGTLTNTLLAVPALILPAAGSAGVPRLVRRHSCRMASA